MLFECENKSVQMLTTNNHFLHLMIFNILWGDSLVAQTVKNLANAGDLCLIPGLGRSPGEGNGYPLRHSCLENPMDRRAWQAIVHGVAKSQTWLIKTNILWTMCPRKSPPIIQYRKLFSPNLLTDSRQSQLKSQ